MQKEQKIKEILFNEDRDLIPKEYSHLMSKKHTLPANFFRGNMFNASAKSKHFKYKKPKLILENKDEQIFVSHALNQKHADVLSLIYADNIGVSKPNPNGSYYIMINLHNIAKLMGYSHPKSAVGYISKYIDDIRHSDFIIYNKKTEIWTKQQILGKAHYDKNQRVFIIYIDGSNAKLLNYTTTIDIPKEKIHKIVDIPNADVLLKAFIRFVISNRASKVNRNLEFFMEKLDLNRYDDNGKLTRASLNKRNAFKKLIKSNTELLSEFNILYDKEENKIYYNEQLEDVKFHLPLTSQPEVMKKIEEEILNSFEPELQTEEQAIDNIKSRNIQLRDMIIKEDRIRQIVETLSVYRPIIEQEVLKGKRPTYDNLTVQGEKIFNDKEIEFLNNSVGNLSKALRYLNESEESETMLPLVDFLISKAMISQEDDSEKLELDLTFKQDVELEEYPQIGKDFMIDGSIYRILKIAKSEQNGLYDVVVINTLSFDEKKARTLSNISLDTINTHIKIYEDMYKK